jgi:hypothetical protein
MKLILENVYWHGTHKFFNFLNRIVHEVLGFAPIMIFIIFFCEVNIFPLLDILTQKIIPCLLWSENK